METNQIPSFYQFVLSEQAERQRTVSSMLQFGVPYLDHCLKGILRNDLVLLGSKSGSGKTEIATHIALTNAKRGKKVRFYSLESEPFEIQRRMLYKELVGQYFQDSDRKPANLNYYDWYCGDLDNVLEKYRGRALVELSKVDNFEVFYKNGQDFTVESLEKEMEKNRGADLIIIDHFHYFDHEAGNENEIYKRLIKRIRDMVFTYSTPIVLIAHLRKSDRKFTPPIPEMEDFHGASDLFKIPTKIILLAGGGKYDPSCDFLKKFPNRNKSALWVSYLTAGKLRQDGTRTKYKATTIFDSEENAYLDYYQLGNFDSDKNWCPLDKIKYPHWASIYDGSGA